MAEQGSKWTAHHSLLPENPGHTCCAPGPVSRSGDAVASEPLQQVQEQKHRRAEGGGAAMNWTTGCGPWSLDGTTGVRGMGTECAPGESDSVLQGDSAGAGPWEWKVLSCSLVTGKSRPGSWSGEVTSAGWGRFQLRAVREEEGTAFLRPSRPRGHDVTGKQRPPRPQGPVATEN